MSDHDEHAPFHYEGTTPIFDRQPNREDREKDAERESEREYKKEQLSLQKQNLWTQIGLVFFGIIGTMISGYQSHTARVSADAAQTAAQTAKDTLTEMRTGAGSVDTHTLAEQAITQAQQTTVLARAAERQANQSDKLATAALAQARTAQVTLVRERPWLATKGFNLIRGDTPHIFRTLILPISNGGRDIATNFNSNIMMIITDHHYPSDDLINLPKNPDCQERLPKGHNIVLPGDLVYIIVQFREKQASEMQDVIAERKSLFVEGCIEYSDATNTVHRTNVSERYLYPDMADPTDIGSFTLTASGNDAN